MDRSKFTNKQLMEIFKLALHKWGQQFQLNMVAEECCELAKTVLKYNRKQNGTSKTDIIREMADVYIMLGQLETIIGLDIPDNINAEINQEFDRKIERLIEMLKVDEGGRHSSHG